MTVRRTTSLDGAIAPRMPFGVLVTMAETDAHVQITVERYREHDDVLDAWPVSSVRVERKAFRAGRIPSSVAKGLGELISHTLAAMAEKPEAESQ